MQGFNILQIWRIWTSYHLSTNIIERESLCARDMAENQYACDHRALRPHCIKKRFDY